MNMHTNDKASAHLYYVSDGQNIHTVRADNWKCTGNVLAFERNEQRVATFLRWDWWKRWDATKRKAIEKEAE